MAADSSWTLSSIPARVEGHAGKQGVAGSIPGGGIHYHFEFSLISRWKQLGEDHTSEIKHDIPE